MCHSIRTSKGTHVTSVQQTTTEKTEALISFESPFDMKY